MSDPSNAASEVAFRPGSAADWPLAAALLGDSSRVTQPIWEAWAADAEARLIVMTRGDALVGFAHLAELGPAEWWVEGLTVQQGDDSESLLRALIAHVVETFSSIGIGLLRFAARDSDAVLVGLAGDYGFRRIISYRPMRGSAQPADYRSFKRLQASNLEVAHQYLRRSPMNRVNHFAEKRGTFYYLTQERLHQYLSDPRVEVLGWRQFDQMHGLAVIHLPADGGVAAPMQIGYLDASDDTTFLAMLAAARGLAAKRGFAMAHWMMPLSAGLDRSVRSTDLQPVSDGELWLFERPLRL